MLERLRNLFSTPEERLHKKIRKVNQTYIKQQVTKLRNQPVDFSSTKTVIDTNGVSDAR